MCFTCPPGVTTSMDGVAITYLRVEDPVTLITDADLASEALAGFEAGDWLYVGVTATVYTDGRPQATRTLYGIPEGLAVQCAFDDAVAMSWLTGDVLDRAANAASLLHPTV